MRSSEDDLLKNVPPHNLEAERALLGSVLMNESVLTGLDLIPEDSAYPPQRFVAAISGAPQETVIAGTDECGGGAPPAAGETTFTVTRGSGSLDGFSAYFQDATTLRRTPHQLADDLAVLAGNRHDAPVVGRLHVLAGDPDVDVVEF